MKFIRASEKDIEKIMSLCKNCSQNMVNNSIDQWDDVYPNEGVFLEDIRTNSLYIAVTDNPEEIIACIVLNEYQDPEYKDIKWNYDREKIAVIHRLMVHPRYEGKGIAKDLVRYIEKLAKDNQYSSIRLDVFAKNLRAVNFYNKLGYKVAGKVTFRKGEFFCSEKLI